MSSSSFASANGSGKDAVCVFCGSSLGSNPAYAEAARSLGQALAQASTELVYGGGQNGLMGIVASSCAAAGGRVHGIIPRAFLSEGEKGSSTASAGEEEGKLDPTRKTTKEGAGRTTVVGTMHERKSVMARESPGGFIVLPGGYGSFEELFEMTTWSQLSIHSRKVLLLNVNSFYSPLREQINKAVEEGFITERNKGLIRFLDAPEGGEEGFDWGKEALKALEEWEWDDSLGYKGLNWDIV